MPRSAVPLQRPGDRRCRSRGDVSDVSSAPRRRAVDVSPGAPGPDRLGASGNRTRRPTTTGGPAKAFVMAKQRPASTSPTSALSTSTATSTTTSSPHLALPVLLGERVVHPYPFPAALTQSPSSESCAAQVGSPPLPAPTRPTPGSPGLTTRNAYRGPTWTKRTTPRRRAEARLPTRA